MIRKGIVGERSGEGGNKRGQSSTRLNDTKRYAHEGWEASCRCGLPPVPDIVLDPFGGSGTVAIVAERLCRKSILIEINPEYVEMIRRRIRKSTPLFSSVDICEGTGRDVPAEEAP